MLTHIKINGKKLFLVGLGFEPHFDILEKNFQTYKQQKSFWIYDKAKLDIAYYLTKSQNKGKTKLTYLTRENYQTVEIKQKILPAKQHSVEGGKQAPMKQLDPILNLIQNYDFFITNTFSDIHPLQAYVFLAKYLNIKLNNQMNQFFRLSFSNHQLSLKGNFLPLMGQVREEYLSTSGLKLRILDRKKQGTEAQFEQILKKWKQHYQIEQTKSKGLHQNSFEEWQFKKSWMAANNFGRQIRRQLLMEGYGRKYSYALIQ